VNDVNVVTDAPQKPVTLPAIVDLRRLLKDEHVSVEKKIKACDQLAIWGPRAWSAAPGLVAQLRNREMLGRHAMNALLANDPGQVIKALTDAIGSGDPLLRAVAADALVEMSNHSDLIRPRITELLRSKDPKVIRAASNVFMEIGRPAPRTAQSLLADMRDPDATEGDAAATALGRLKDDDGTITKTLGDMLDEQLIVRRRAAIALAGDGIRPRSVLGRLTAALADDDLAVRRDAATAIARIGPEAASAVPALIANLRRGDASSTTAAGALGAIGVAARPAASAIISAIRSAPPNPSGGDISRESDRLRSTCATALARIDPDSSATADLLLDSVRRRDWVVRETLAPALAASPARQSLTPALIALTRDFDDLVRVNARCALRELRGSAATRPAAGP
jgi:HEAT repeat protein